ncbi:MAG: hypothetical protein KAH20_09080 [Methylococcales bacterium]|nr:hypothetical protein [Methylococcales bacterium]
MEVSALEKNIWSAGCPNNYKLTLKAPNLSKNNHLLIGGSWNNNKSILRLVSQQEGTSILYWINGEMGYALTGSLNKAKSLKLSVPVYQQTS